MGANEKPPLPPPALPQSPDGGMGGVAARGTNCQVWLLIFQGLFINLWFPGAPPSCWTYHHAFLWSFIFLLAAQ